MKFIASIIFGLSVAGFSADDVKVSDWRVELLGEEGIGSSVEELQKALTAVPEVTNELDDALEMLASQDFDEREGGRKKLMSGGEDALKWLLEIEPSEDPALRRRVLSVIEELGLVFRKDREVAVEHAVKSLLAEGLEGRVKSADTGGMFFEWFCKGNLGLLDLWKTEPSEAPPGRLRS